jgi:hypothetical protein
VFEVWKGAVPVSATTVSGTDPLVLTFDMCRSDGPYKLAFDVDVDGAKVAAGCRSTLTFTASGVKAGGAVRGAVAGRSYDVWMRVRSLAANNEPQAAQNVKVEVVSAATGCAADTAGPNATLRLPAGGSIYSTPAHYPVHFESLADDSSTGNSGVARVEYKVNYPGPTQAVLGPATSAPYSFDWTQADVEKWLGSDCRRIATLQAFAVDGCGNATYSAGVQVTLASTATSCAGGPAAATPAEHAGALLSDLSVPGGAGQVVVNGTALFPRAGRTALAVQLSSGENRVEATLVEGASAGTWRFELGGARLMDGSLRVVAGTVVQSGGDAISFRVQGRAGERVVFSFAVSR